MRRNAGNAESSLSRGLRYLTFAVTAASLIKVIVHFSGIGLTRWLSGIIEIYRATIYPIHQYTYELIIGLIGMHLTDLQRDLITIYIIGCAAQARYLAALRSKLDPVYGMGVNVPFIVYMGTVVQTIYVMLWPVIILIDTPIRFLRRRLWLYLIRRSPHHIPMGVFDDIVSSRYALIGFVRGLIHVIMIVLVFLLMNAVGVSLSK